METMEIPKQTFEQMKTEINTLRKTALYSRLLEFEQNIAKKKFSRKDLGF